MSNVLPNVRAILTEAKKDLATVLAHAREHRSGEGDDFSFYAVDIDVGEHCEAGINDNRTFTVDIETGIRIIEAARKIIDERIAEVSQK